MHLKKSESDDNLHLVGSCDIVLHAYDDDFNANEEKIGEINFSLYHMKNYVDDVEDLLNDADADSQDKFDLVDAFVHFLIKTSSSEDFFSPS